jgi:hypothetical protein
VSTRTEVEFLEEENAELRKQLAAAKAAATTIQLATQGALSIGETAYHGFTAEKGNQRICWEALDPDERRRWNSSGIAVRNLTLAATREAAARGDRAAMVRDADGDPF